MYYRYFGLQEEPFSIAVNPKYLFMSARHRDALAHLLYGVGSGGGFILLTGEVGTGKTTINRCLMQQLPADTDVAVILNPALNAEELLASVCDELGIGYEPGAATLKDLTDKLQNFLLENHAKGRNTVLLIDEAQHLQFEVLEQIRLLTNLETNTRKLLQIILVGQPELAAMLAKPELRQLSQRVTARYNLQALNLEETDAYIRHRLQVAGLPANQELFPRAVVRRIYRYTGGIPRLVNVLCDRTLLGTYGQNKPRVDQQMLKQAAAEVLGDAGAGQAANTRWWLLAAALGVMVLGLALWWRNSLLPSPAGTQPAPVATVAISPAVAGEVQRAAAPMPWLRNREAAIAALAAYLGVPAGASDTCSAALESGWRCETLRGESWDELLDVGRPAMLSLLTPQRFATHAVLVGVSGDSAVIIGDQTRQTVALAQLGPLWRGEFLILWQPPALYSTPFGLGDRGPLVTWLAQEFAQLDGQTQALATDVFNANLEQRVRLFQRQHGLLDDGVVGLKTLLKFNLVRGIDVPLQGNGSALASGGKS